MSQFFAFFAPLFLPINFDLDYFAMRLLIAYFFLLTLNTSLVQAQCTSVAENDSLQLVELHLALNGPEWGDSAWLSNPVYQWEGVSLTEDNCNVLSIQLVGANVIKGQIPNLEFPFLEIFNLNNDSIYGDIPDFSGCPKLKILNLSNNSLTGELPDFALDSLESVNVINNGLSGEVPDFQGLPSLSSLQLSFNELTGAFPNFSNMPSLTSLGLCPNEFEIGYPDLAEGAPLLNIDFVDLSCLNCTSISDTDSLELRKLYESLGGELWSNKTGWIDTIQLPVTNWFGVELSRDECEVVGLNFVNNNLSNSFPEDFSIETITSVRLNQNRITGNIPDFVGLPNLELLDLFSNEFYGELPDFQLPNLVSLDASFNNLSGPIPDFSSLPKLEKLSLRLNGFIGPLPEFGNMDSLKFLTLDFNSIDKNIPDFQTPNLEIIDLGNNQLGGEIPDFNNLQKLEVLSLENNGLCGNVPNFNNIPNLSFLSVCPNPYLFGSVDLSNTPNLDLDNTDLSCIQENETFDCSIFNALESLSNTQIEVFPNPTSNNLQLNLPDFTNGRVNIYNALGALVLEQNIYTNKPKLNLSSFENGLYVLEVVLEERFVLRETVVKVAN